MSDDYELQHVTTHRLRELLQYEKDNHILRAVNADLYAALVPALAYLEWMLAPGEPGRDCILHQLRAALTTAEGRR